jgi:UrcA family protein
MKRVILSVAIGMAGSLLLGGAAIAQSTEEVTVTAAGVVEKDSGGAPGGARVLDMSFSYPVSYKGLDLASHAGAIEFQKRVKDAARDACKEISRQRPLAHLTPDEDGCAKAAADKAMVRVNELIAAAEKKPMK